MPLSEIRETSISLFNDIFGIGLKYVKHKTIASFFISLFKPRMDSIIKSEAPEKDLLEVMWLIKKKIDPVLAKFDKIESVLEARGLNDEKMQHKVENLLLKDVQAFIPKEIKIDEQKASEILARLRNGPKM